MGRKVKLWTALAICLALAVTVRPVAFRIGEAEENARQVEEIEDRVVTLGEGQRRKYLNLAKWYNHQLELGSKGLRGIYGSILDLGEGRMGALEVPELNLHLPISHGYSGKLGHDPSSPLPIGGRGNHTVLILTQGYAWRSEQMVHLDILGQRLSYRVQSVQVMPPGWSLERPTEAGQDLLTLVYDHGNTRTIVRCVRCADLTVRPDPSPERWQVILAAVWPLALVMGALVRAKSERTPRIWGFYRENPEKSKLF